MNIRISKDSEIPLRRQLAEQIVFLIATEELKPGEVLPSVRQLARRLGIHHNTVSAAYQDLVRRTWLLRRRGSRLMVGGAEGGAGARAAPRPELDDLINAVIRLAQQQGHSLQALRDRVRQRLLAQPPDHILVVEEETGLRRLLQAEIQQAMRWPVGACSRRDLAGHPGAAIGALLAAPQYALAHVDRLAPKDRPAVPLAFGAAREQVARIRQLREPSVIAVVSVSELFLRTAESLLASAVAPRHTLAVHALPLASPRALRAADLVFCDSIACRQVRHPKRVEYQLIASASLEYLATAMQSYQQR